MRTAAELARIDFDDWTPQEQDRQVLEDHLASPQGSPRFRCVLPSPCVDYGSNHLPPTAGY